MSKKYLMSDVQKRLFITEQIQGLNTAYNMPAIFEVTGRIEAAKLLDALYQMTEHHDILRTKFAYEGERYVQIIQDCVAIDYEVTTQFTSIEEEYHQFMRPFDLEKDCLFRFKILLGKSSSIIMTDFHHIIFDGVSTSLFFEELSNLYAGEQGSRSQVQYIHYSSWKKNLDLSKQEHYWINVLSEVSHTLDLPYDFPRKSIRSYKGAYVIETLDLEMMQALKALCATHGTTAYVVMLSALSILLHDYSHQGDFTIGTITAGRNHPQLEHLIGMFVNTLVMACEVNKDDTVEQHLIKMKEVVFLAFENQDYPFERLVEKFGHGDPSRNPLFDVMFVFQNLETTTLNLGEMTLSPIEIEDNIAKFDSTLMISETNAGYELSWEYRTDLFAEQTIKQTLKHYKNILQGMLHDLSQKVGELNVLSTQEQKTIVDIFNKTKQLFPRGCGRKIKKGISTTNK